LFYKVLAVNRFIADIGFAIGVSRLSLNPNGINFAAVLLPKDFA